MAHLSKFIMDPTAKTMLDEFDDIEYVLAELEGQYEEAGFYIHDFAPAPFSSTALTTKQLSFFLLQKNREVRSKKENLDREAMRPATPAPPTITVPPPREKEERYQPPRVFSTPLSYEETKKMPINLDRYTFTKSMAHFLNNIPVIHPALTVVMNLSYTQVEALRKRYNASDKTLDWQAKDICEADIYLARIVNSCLTGTKERLTTFTSKLREALKSKPHNSRLQGASCCSALRAFLSRAREDDRAFPRAALSSCTLGLHRLDGVLRRTGVCSKEASSIPSKPSPAT